LHEKATRKSYPQSAGPSEAVGEAAAFEVVAELALHLGRHALPIPIVFPCERKVGLQVLLDHLVQGGLLGTAIDERAASL
jgi:hypothetical protein